jgi:hypothetical protein
VFCFGLAVGSAFCMKWLESGFRIHGESFNMFGLELFYSKERVAFILANIDDAARTALRHHLYFDFTFMTGIFPAISALCMMARSKVASRTFQALLFILAASQMLAWAGDVAEDLFLLSWLDHPVIGKEFNTYHLIVAAKWIIGVSGFLVSACILVTRLRIKKN